MFFLCVCVCVYGIVPRSREEVEVVVLIVLPPNETDAGGLVEGQQCPNDDVLLFCGCGRKKATNVTLKHTYNQRRRKMFLAD